MPDVYEGDRPYIFVSYAHADDDAVLPLLDALVAEGYRVWWDKGIELSAPFPDYIARHVYRCACFVPLLSRASLESPWCCKEIKFASRYRKQILPVFIEDVELPLGLDLQIGDLQALRRLKFNSDKAFYAELFGARALDPCLTTEGARRRGAKARDPQPRAMVTKQVAQIAGATVARTAIVQSDIEGQGSSGAGSSGRAVIDAHAVAIGGTSGASRVAIKDKLAAYSWTDLKELSQAIAKAGSDVEGLAIARSYHLADEDGRLRGDEKPLQLEDGTRTSVRILGFRHDELASGRKSGISFEFANVPTTHRMNPTCTNEGGWEGSEMRRWLNSDFLALLPEDLRSSIVTVQKRTNNKGEVARNDTSSVTATTDRLWFLSMSEVYGRLTTQQGRLPWSPATYDAEGNQYRLYADKGVTTTSYGFCAKSGASSGWWLRSPYAFDSIRFRYVDFVGHWRAHLADCVWGVSPGFCL